MKQSIVLAIGILLASASFTPIILVHAKMTSQELIQKKLIIDKKIIQLEREIERLQANLQYKIKEFRQTQSDIADTEKELKEVEGRMQDRSKIIDERMVAYQSQKSTINLYVDVLLESESLSDLLTKSISIKTLLDADRSLLNQQTEDRDELKTLQITLQMKKEKLQKQFQAMQEQEKDLEVKKVENNAKSLKLKEQIATKKKKEKLERERIVKEKEAARLKALAEKEFLAQQVAGESEEV
ncbi:MAG: peptidoglycan-binding protein, partial [Kurthia sp.]|nr:peptidoglycan-binding protein [Kurthia sp.]